ncbi:MAG: transglutaminase domain-containing protein [Oscillospiraceae bacterium]|nr:transglutaminase domain-containing protein [Oscillospiraceae bacterium]
MVAKSRSRSSGRRGPLAVVCIVLTLILAVLIAVALMLNIQEQKLLANVRRELTVEAGTQQVLPEELLYQYSGEPVTFLSAVTQEQLKTPGEYPVSVSWQNKKCDAVIRVVDTVKPQGTPVSLSAIGTLPEASQLVKDIADVTDVTVRYKEEPDMTKAGATAVALVLTDTSGNETELTATLTVIVDTTAPVLSGVKPVTVYLGSAVAYRTGITVTDDYDSAPTFSVDSSEVDLGTVGKYKVVYTAVDASGNQATKETTVTVIEKKENAADLDTIYAAADRVLGEIIKDNMTKRQQVVAIYNWARSNLGYSGHSDKSDYLQGAYVMLTKRSGDCFNYYAVTKLMLDRLGIDNIDVRKVKNHSADSDHFWSLVSLDDGKTWYHFDSTPRMGNGDDFCLVTDAFLDAYSDAHDKCHNRDKSLYPATPVN